MCCFLTHTHRVIKYLHVLHKCVAPEHAVIYLCLLAFLKISSGTKTIILKNSLHLIYWFLCCKINKIKQFVTKTCCYLINKLYNTNIYFNVIRHRHVRKRCMRVIQCIRWFSQSSDTVRKQCTLVLKVQQSSLIFQSVTSEGREISLNPWPLDFWAWVCTQVLIIDTPQMLCSQQPLNRGLAFEGHG